MECRDVREMADSFVAGELLTETNHAVLRHLETCKACRAEVASRQELRRRLQDAVMNAPGLEPSRSFVPELRAKLREEAQRVEPRRAARLRPWLALAATLVLSASLGVAWRLEWLEPARALARAAVGDHLNCALQFRLKEKPISLEEAARREDVSYRVFQSLPAAQVVSRSGPARVLERHSCVYGGRRFAHIVLDFRGRRVSLLATASTGRLRRVSTKPWIAAPIDGMSVVVFETARHTIVLTGDVAAPDLAGLADAVAEPLTAALGA